MITPSTQVPARQLSTCCSNCRAPVTRGAKFCGQCGHEVQSAMDSMTPAQPRAANTAECGAKEAAPIVQPPVTTPREFAAWQAPAGLDGIKACSCGTVPVKDARFCHTCGLPRSQDSGLWVRCIAADKIERNVPLGEDDLVIGKDSSCGLAVPGDPYLSQRHARLHRDQGLVFVEDLGSSNGTLLRIKRPIALEPGDELVVGTTVLLIEDRSSSPE